MSCNVVISLKEDEVRYLHQLVLKDLARINDVGKCLPPRSDGYYSRHYYERKKMVEMVDTLLSWSLS